MRKSVLSFMYFILFIIVLANLALAGHREIQTGAFAVEHELVIPGTPDVIYDAISGDISAWWDHSFSEKPFRLYLEAKPGGGFIEIFNDNGDGVRHADVIFAQRGKMLRFEGPLGLSGRAIHMVHTYSFSPVGKDSTRLQLKVHAIGEIEEGLASTVDNVWKHFLFERFKPYIETGAYRDKLHAYNYIKDDE